MWWYLPTRFWTIYDFQVDSTLDVCSSTLSSRLAVAHPIVVCMRYCSPAGLTDYFSISTKKESRWNFMRWVEGGRRNSHLLPGCLWMNFHFDFPRLSAFDWVLVLLCLRGDSPNHWGAPWGSHCNPKQKMLVCIFSNWSYSARVAFGSYRNVSLHSCCQPGTPFWTHLL